MILKEFNTLYKRVHNGEMINVKGQKMQQWKIWVEDKDGICTIYTSHGQVGGKIAEDKGTVIKEGKNLGRANATTVQEQAVREAQSKYDKKKDEGYTESIEEAKTKIYWFPMLAKQYNKMKKLEFPYIAQIKLDGVRAWAFKENGEIILESREKKRFSGFPGIRETLKDLPENYILDGELYAPKTLMSFEKLVGIIKKEKGRDKKEEEKISYHAFDLFDKKDFHKPFSTRYEDLKKYVKGKPKIQIVENMKDCKTEAEVEEELQKSIDQGYEGVILRKANSKYTLDFRTSGLLKYKTTMDEEFEVIGFKEGVGNYAGTPVWQCITQEGLVFDVTGQGTVEERQELFPKAHEKIGKMLTVRFQEYTDRGVPKFPQPAGFRDYE